MLNDVLDVGLAAIVVGALVPGTRLAAVLSWPLLRVLGMMCYSIYMWHLPLLKLIAGDRALMSAPVFAGKIIAFLIVTFVVSALSYRFIEFPRIDNWRRLFLLNAPAMIGRRP